MTGRIGIDDVAPVIAGGRYPAKAVVGEVVPVAATVWREGHDAVAATLVVRCLGPSYPQFAEGPLRRISAPRDRDKNAARVKPVHIRMQPGGALDRFHANFVPDREGLWTFRVDGWGDPVATWRHNVAAKLEAGQGAAELANDLEIGARLFERAAAGVPRKRRQPLLDSADALRTDNDPGARFQHALSVEALGLLDEFRCAICSLGAPSTASGWTVPAHCMARGTSCSRVPPVASDRTDARCTAPWRPPPQIWPASLPWDSTWCTCRRFIPSAR